MSSSQIEQSTNDIILQDEQCNNNKVIEMKEEEEEEEINNNNGSLSSLLSGMCDVSKLMNSEGPIVKAVVLRCDGTISEIDYDTTPKKYLVKTILGASPTIIGEWEEIQVIAVRGLHESTDIPFNANKLRFPFNNEQFRGDILLYRVNNEGAPENFTLTEYEAFLARRHEDDGKVWDNEPCTTETAINTENMENEDDMEIMQEEISAMVERQFENKYGRKPTPEEKSIFANAVMQTFFGDDANDDDDEDYNFCPTVEEEEEYEDDNDEEEEEEEENNEDNENEENEEQATQEEEEENEEEEEEEEEAMSSNEEVYEPLEEALEDVRKLDHSQKLEILERARLEYEAETGATLDNETLLKAFSLFKVDAIPSHGSIEDNASSEKTKKKDDELEADLTEFGSHAQNFDTEEI